MILKNDDQKDMHVSENNERLVLTSEKVVVGYKSSSP